MLNRGSKRQRSGPKAGAVDVVSNESVGTREVAFTLGAGGLARGCVNMQLLILPSVRLLVMVWTICPIGKNKDVGRLGDPVLVPMWDGGCRSSVSYIRQQLHHLARVHIGDL